jgi:beta-lactam-binding protein with PASTA domain
MNSAVTALTQAGFETSVQLRPTSNNDEVGRVIEQRPGGGTRAPEGSTVTIWVGAAETDIVVVSASGPR